MKLSLTIFGIALLVQSVVCAPVYDEELIEANPEARGVLDMIMAVIPRPLVSTIGQGIVDVSTFIEVALNNVGGTAGSLFNNVNGIRPLNKDQPILIQQDEERDEERDEEILRVINALLHHIHLEPPKETTGTSENDEMMLLDEIVNADALSVSDTNGVEEIPLYLLLV